MTTVVTNGLRISKLPRQSHKEVLDLTIAAQIELLDVD